jgi:hypothetical protein
VLDASGLDFTPGSYHCRVGALTTKPEKKVGKRLPKAAKKSTTIRFEHVTSSQLPCIILHYPVQSGSVFQAYKRKKGAASLGVWMDSAVGRLNSKRFELQMGGFSSLCRAYCIWVWLSSRIGIGAFVITFESDARTNLQFTHYLEPWGSSKSNEVILCCEDVILHVDHGMLY